MPFWRTFLFALAICFGVVALPSNTASPLPMPQTLRVAAPHQTCASMLFSPYGEGWERDLVHSFSEQAGYSVVWVPVSSSAEALIKLYRKEVDLTVGFAETILSGARNIARGPEYSYTDKTTVSTHSQDVCKELLAGGSRSCTEYAHELVLDFMTWQLWQHLAEDAAPALRKKMTLPSRWHWRQDNVVFDAQFKHFWRERSQPHDTLLAELTEQYFGFMPDAFDATDLNNLQKTVKTVLPRYAKTIAEAAKTYDIDPLLLVAVIFQESRFDPHAVSPTGVRGIMQLTQRTADFLKVDRMNPHEAIRGGARYLRKLWDDLDDLNLEPVDRWNFALVAFNQGAGHLRDSIRLAKKLGYTGDTWHEIQPMLLKLTQPKYYKQSRYGYFRGNEAVGFVKQVRWYYHVLLGLALFDRPERQQLTPLLTASTSRW